jgi:hypothetical protein
VLCRMGSGGVSYAVTLFASGEKDPEKRIPSTPKLNNTYLPSLRVGRYYLVSLVIGNLFPFLNYRKRVIA